MLKAASAGKGCFTSWRESAASSTCWRLRGSWSGWRRRFPQGQSRPTPLSPQDCTLFPGDTRSQQIFCRGSTLSTPPSSGEHRPTCGEVESGGEPSLNLCLFSPQQAFPEEKQIHRTGFKFFPCPGSFMQQEVGFRGVSSSGKELFWDFLLRTAAVLQEFTELLWKHQRGTTAWSGEA